MSEYFKKHDTLHDDESDAVRSIERTRLSALVERNIEVARPLHAADFQLVTPVGMLFSKEQYLGAIATGGLIYNAWDPKQIEVRLYENTAVIRYQSSMEVTFGPHHISRAEYWHTDLYEKRAGSWQVVWSQATGIQAAA
ncbi:MAG TPA: nuclear transport factor 2 family protein [Polaromonas sp.]|uniref:nuclear transport factor 2 family protein n=1 Tax=Polaromonas sp. TaxID=1869339 RepID=UPI002D319E75|nr:nuclear transport factor 2 family protein [Polaromonas sp.]HYW56672.1 nuclear transport factor 2 family protein [Polaromonas sp.]